MDSEEEEMKIKCTARSIIDRVLSVNANYLVLSPKISVSEITNSHYYETPSLLDKEDGIWVIQVVNLCRKVWSAT
jgi:hypothetical protein